MNEKLNTIYIISKGRPHCITANVLTKIKYTGEWFIVCGSNDVTIDEYKKNWGESRVLVFDWYEEVKQSDLLDNFGVEKMSSGAVPVRNATRKISENRGEKRHWQFDDDYTGFYHIDKTKTKWHRLTGAEMERELRKLANYGLAANLANIGIAVSSESRPENIKMIGNRVFNAHNLPSEESLFTKWRGRMNDDLINAIETHRAGRREYHIKYMNLVIKKTQSERGGNTDIYVAHGTVRKAAYAVMIAPKDVKLTIRHGRYHHKCNWRGIVPKLIHEKHR